MSSGHYEEILPCNGKLKIKKNSWEISYYFSGPDMRYNGTFVSIPGNLIEAYISALNENWADYEQLKLAIPNGGEFKKIGKLGMNIRIGSFAQGVCLESYHMPINSKRQLDETIEAYRYAANRAPQIQNFLANL